jgi:class 3 adenylate cyclase/tetratricopeptide (TPR) repeat protein
VECGTCGFENPGDARFCSRCGTSLARSCPACGHDAAPAARFCSFCGTDLDTEAPPQVTDRDLARYVPESLLRKIRAARTTGSMRGERRTVTMLFADLVGSTAAAEQLDPEDWADVVNGAFAHLIAPVYRYEGTLARLQGDAILAFFGAPIAHEDDPVRAVHAGLEMLESVAGYADEMLRTSGTPVAIRVGINTGLVVVGEVGSDLRVEYTALGDAINVAARMEQTAEPGTVRVTEHTAALLGDAFATTRIGAVEVKGKGEPVTAVRVDGVRATSAGPRCTTPLLGRDAELAAFREVIDRLRAGFGGVVTVVGEAGIGKSRLLAAVRDELERQGGVADGPAADGEVAWLEGRSRSFDAGVPYAPFRDMAARWLGLADVPAERTFERVAAAVEAAHGVNDLDMAAYLTHIAGAPLPDEQAKSLAATGTTALHAHATNAVVAYFEAEAARRPSVLLLDDLHWADALSLALAERLLRATEHAAIVVVIVTRPVRDEPAWRLVEVAAREAADRHTSLQLDALPTDIAGELLDQLVGGGHLAPERREQLLTRADGNPLFLEELAGSLHGPSGVLPVSLSGLLTARLDRLGDEVRRVAEVAAVVGQEFDLGDVAALFDGDGDADARLRELVRRGVLVERQRRPRPRYGFRHALLQEAAYETILLKERRRLHRRLARHLETAAPDAPHEVARHHLAGDDPDAAFPWLVSAGERATRVMAVAEAIRAFTTALERVPSDADPDVVARAHLGLGEAFTLVPDLDQAAAAYQSLVAFGEACGRPTLQVRALNQLGINAAMLAADFDTALGFLGRAREIAQGVGDERGLAEYHVNSCFIAAAQGHIDRAIEHDEATVRIGQDLGSEEVRVAGLTRRVMNLVSRLELDEAARALEEAEPIVRAAGDEEELALLLGSAGSLLALREGDLGGALELFETSIATLRRFGSFQAPMQLYHAARTALALGRVERALDMLATADEVAEEIGAEFAKSGVAAVATLTHATCGQAEESAAWRARALEMLTLPLGDFEASSVWADLAFGSLETGRAHEAEADAMLGLEASSSTRFWERPRLLTAAASAVLARDDTARARALIEEADALMTDNRLVLHRPALSSVAARLAHREGDLEGAERHLAAAAEVAGRAGMRLLACEVARDRAEVAHEDGRRADAALHREQLRNIAEDVLAEVSDPLLHVRLAGRLFGATAEPEPS